MSIDNRGLFFSQIYFLFVCFALEELFLKVFKIQLVMMAFLLHDVFDC